MTKFLTLISVCVFLSASAQVTITSDNLPHEGETLIQKAAFLTATVDLEDSGADHSWTFDEALLQPLGTTTETVCLDVADSPLLYQFLFNNPFDPEHNADFAFGVDDIDIAGFITFTDVYWYYQNNSDEYTAVGQGVTINEIPLPTQADPVDVIYELPIEFSDESSSYSELEMDVPKLFAYKLEQTRSNVVDGWGTIDIWGVEYDVLRVRTEIAATDSFYVSAFQLGQSLDRPLVVEYKWLSPDYNVPVLQITTSGGFVTSVLTADIAVGISESEFSSFEIFPNPASDFIHISGTDSKGADVEVFSSSGLLVYSGVLSSEMRMDISMLARGNYNLVMRNGSTLVRKCFIIE